jgi:hypothetical protein
MYHLLFCFSKLLQGCNGILVVMFGGATMDVATICTNTFNFDNSFAFVTRNTFEFFPKIVHLWVLGTLSLHSPFQRCFFFNVVAMSIMTWASAFITHYLFFTNLWQLSTL